MGAFTCPAPKMAILAILRFCAFYRKIGTGLGLGLPKIHNSGQNGQSCQDARCRQGYKDGQWNGPRCHQGYSRRQAPRRAFVIRVIAAGRRQKAKMSAGL